jgi:hypothetical protein
MFAITIVNKNLGMQNLDEKSRHEYEMFTSITEFDKDLADRHKESP